MASLRLLMAGADVRGFRGFTGICTGAAADLHLAAGDYPKAVDEYRTLLDGMLVPSLDARSSSWDWQRHCAGWIEGERPWPSPAKRRMGSAPAAPRSRRPWLATGWPRLSSRRTTRPRASHCCFDPGGVRGGLNVTADFRMRLLVAVAMNESADGEHEHALAYLEEARGLEGEMDDLRRARYLYNLAVEYQETGDYEGGLRAGAQAAALFRAAELEREMRRWRTSRP